VTTNIKLGEQKVIAREEAELDAGYAGASDLRFVFVGMFFCVFFLEFFGHFAVFHYECSVISAVSALPDGPQLR